MISQWAGRILTALMIAWGTFAAVVAFAVRYDLGLFASPDVAATPTTYSSTEESIRRPRVGSEDWHRLLGPSDIAESFRIAIGEHTSRVVDSNGLDASKLSLRLDFRLVDSSAVWEAGYKLGCDCPYVAPEDTPKILAVIDPFTGAVLSLVGSETTLLPNTGDTLTGHTGEEVRP
jgi:hypothetical protein